MATPDGNGMSFGARLLRQFRGLSVVLPLSYGITILVLILTAIQDRVPPLFLLRDPSQVTRHPFYIGLLSNVGALLWCAAATICFYTAGLVKNRRSRLFLFSSGLLTALLGLDDFFVLHESVFPIYLGVAERVVVGVYGILVLVYLSAFRRKLLQSDFLPLIFAFGFFAWSIALDFRFMIKSPIDYLLDDGLKLLGIVSWFVYLVRTCRQEIDREALADTPAEQSAAVHLEPIS